MLLLQQKLSTQVEVKEKLKDGFFNTHKFLNYDNHPYEYMDH